MSISQMQTWPLLSAVPSPCQFKAEFELLERPEPYICGLYVLWAAGMPVYIGQSSNLVARLQEHRKTKKFDTATWYPVPSYATRLQLETILIAAALPAYNRLLYLGISKDRIWEVRHRAAGSKAPRPAAHQTGTKAAPSALLLSKTSMDKRAKRLRKAGS